MKTFCIFVLFVLFSVSFAFSAEEGLIGYWKFDEGKGDVAGDSSGNKNDGKIIRNPEWVDGKFGKALKFDGGQRNKVEIPHSDSFAEIKNAVTIEAWINPANFNVWTSFGVKGDITYGMFINPSAYVRMHYSGGSTLDTPANSIKANEWTHVVGTYDGKAVRIYLNGEMKAELATNVAIPANTASFVIGGTQESRDWFTGMVDEVKLYSRGLTEEEIKKSMSGASVETIGKLSATWGNIKKGV
ncbi:TPA: LamG domain-containing protein [bacterium]|nr:LamG domain-containing protein [bacterium]